VRRQTSRGLLVLLPSRLAAASSGLRHNRELLRNASSLAATTGLTSFFGFAYWIYAARVFPTEAVGYGTAAISTMMLLGTLGMFGLDTMLIGEIPRGGNRGGLIMASCVAAFVVSLVLGLGFALVSLAFGTHFVEINGTVGRIAVFSFGAAITGATVVFDAGTIGLMRGGLQLSRNVAVSIAKMACLPAAAYVLHDQFGVGILLAWVGGTVISLLPVAITIKRSGDRILYRPDWGKLWHLRKVALAHNWLNLAINIPIKLIPVLVVIVVTPSSNGAYYIATMISGFLYMIPTSLSMVLFAIASAAPEKIAEKLRFVVRMSFVIGIPGGLAMGLCAHFILSAFGSTYAALATGPLWILIIGYVPNLFNTTYIAVARAKGRFNQAAVFLTGFAAFRMAALVVGGKIGGLYGLSYAMLAVTVIQALITTPSVLRTAFGRATVSSAADSTITNAAGPQSAEVAEGIRLQQEAGLAALIALASRVVPSQPQVDTDILGTDSLGSPRPPTSIAAQRSVRHQDRHQQLIAARATRANPAITDTNWWPDIDEATFGLRQEMGVAALVAIATQAAQLSPVAFFRSMAVYTARTRDAEGRDPEVVNDDLSSSEFNKLWREG
jgi:O-antigen/teichoic acid export membrane protein